jgi:beta-lactamase regulating signal transducer with metallopeptidase domain
MSMQFLESAARSVFHASWQAAILGLLVLVVCRAFRRISATARCSLWMVVLIRLLVPLAPQSSISLFNLARLPGAAAPANGTGANKTAANDTGPLPDRIEPTSARAGFGAEIEDLRVLPERMESNRVTAPVTDGAIAAERIAPKQNLWRLVVSLWALGIGVFLCRGIVSAYRVHRVLRRCRLVTDGHLSALLESCRLQAGMRRQVDLLVADFEIAPALTGILKPRIIVSQTTLDSIGPHEFRWLFRHELAHVRRHDVLLQRFWSLACTLHWFNPLVWWASSRAMFEAELACDELVIGREPQFEQVGYARALVKTAEVLMTPQALSGTVGLLVREPALAKRVRAIANYKRRSRRTMLVGAVILLCLAGAGLTDAVESNGPQTTAEKISAQASSQRLPLGPDSRRQLSAVLDAWEHGHRLLSSYDLYVTLGEQVHRDPRAATTLPASAPTSATRLIHAARSGKRNRVEYGVGEPGQKADQILLWDGELARYYIPADRTLRISKRPELGCLNLETFYNDCTYGTDTVDFLRKRAETIVERADAAAVVLYLPPKSTYGLRVWLDPAKNYLPSKIERLDGRSGKAIVEFRQENTFAEFAPGIWGPTKMVEARYDRFNESAAFEVVIAVNQKTSRFHAVLDDSAFQLSIPPGTMVFDRIVDARYRLGKAKTPAEQASQQAIEGRVTAKELLEFAEKSGITAELQQAAPNRRRTQQKNPVPNPAVRRSLSPINPKELASTKGKVRIHVLDSGGKPLAGAQIFANVVHPGGEKWAISNRYYLSDAAGQAIVELPRTVGVTKIWVHAPLYPGLFACWFPDVQSDADEIPEDFAFQQPKGTPIGGILIGDDGKPVAGAKVEVKRVNIDDMALLVKKPGKRPVLDDWLSEDDPRHGIAPCITGPDGRWILYGVPAGVEVLLKLSHPDYIGDQAPGDLQHAQGVSMESLRDQTAVITMRHIK